MVISIAERGCLFLFFVFIGLYMKVRKRNQQFAFGAVVSEASFESSRCSSIIKKFARKILDPDGYWLQPMEFEDVKLEFPQIFENSNELLTSCGNAMGI